MLAETENNVNVEQMLVDTFDQSGNLVVLSKMNGQGAKVRRINRQRRRRKSITNITDNFLSQSIHKQPKMSAFFTTG
jgi:hypothetical protein